MTQLALAVIQMSPGDDRERNFHAAESLLAQAAARGAKIAVLPEMFSRLEPAERWARHAEPPGGPVEEFLSDRARSLGLYIVGGSYVEEGGDGRFYNTCPVVGPDGKVIGRYRKMHLFWIEIEGKTAYDERSYLAAGKERLVFEAYGFRISVGICYDLRFPEFFRAGRGEPADVFCLPAAFMEATGRAHWEVLVRARAIENLAYFAAAATVGKHYEIAGRPGETVRTFGHSMVVSPWGEVVGGIDNGEGVAVAEVRGGEIRAARGRLAALDHARDDL